MPNAWECEVASLLSWPLSGSFFPRLLHCLPISCNEWIWIWISASNLHFTIAHVWKWGDRQFGGGTAADSNLLVSRGFVPDMERSRPTIYSWASARRVGPAKCGGRLYKLGFFTQDESDQWMLCPPPLPAFPFTERIMLPSVTDGGSTSPLGREVRQAVLSIFVLTGDGSPAMSASPALL